MIPVTETRWLDELPESMTEAEYRELPEEIARTVEVVNGTSSSASRRRRYTTGSPGACRLRWNRRGRPPAHA